MADQGSWRAEMAKLPLFSVVICTYNRSRPLTRALGSVLGQVEADFEVVVVDDGSEDDTADVVAGFGSPLVRYVRRRNGGLSAARNTGIDHARGELITFLDDDDRAEPTWLSTLGEQVDDRTGVVCCGCWFDDPDDGSSRVVLPETQPEAFHRVEALFLAGTFAVRREIYARVGGYAEDIPTSHQTELALRLVPEVVRGGLTVRSVDAPLVHIERRAAARRIWSPEDLLEGARYLLDHHAPRLAHSPSVLADYHAVAAVSAFQVGDRPQSRRHFRAAVHADPRNLRHAARYALAHVPALATRVWGRHGTMSR